MIIGDRIARKRKFFSLKTLKRGNLMKKSQLFDIVKLWWQRMSGNEWMVRNGTLSEKEKNFLHTRSEGMAWLAGIVARTKEKGSCTRTRGGQSLVRSLNWPTTLCCGGRHATGLHASHFLHFLWNFSYAYDCFPDEWIEFKYLIKEFPFLLEFEFPSFKYSERKN